MTHSVMLDPIEPIPLDLLRDPLVWFFAEHYRHRDICSRLLDLSASVSFDRDVFDGLHTFLSTELPLHIIDEEDDLFPLLRRRCEPDDQIEKVLGMLSSEHANDQNLALAVTELIAACLEGRRGLGALSESGKLIPRFCHGQRRHIAVENAVVLPIARKRLLDRDLHDLGQRLATRRGLPDPYLAAS